ncbi:btb poz domain-containing protein [Colletotrichum incanum]|uniref:Btb poz domain-containing protein n=1 Tax=Colletotrichum incanum TaxID=1573173 RepID=A0A161WM94_COLIC|nr:btb poz domain-containing protein [Colletotrichum incanum]
MECIPNARWLLETGKLSDFTIICKSTETRVHKVVLYAHSGYFAALLDSNMKEAQEGVVTFNDIDPEPMKRLIDIFYSGSQEFSFTPSDLRSNLNVWILADRMQARQVMRKIESRLMDYFKVYENKTVGAQANHLDMVLCHICNWFYICRGYLVVFIKNEDVELCQSIMDSFDKHTQLARKMLLWSLNYGRIVYSKGYTGGTLFDSTNAEKVRAKHITASFTEAPEALYRYYLLDFIDGTLVIWSIQLSIPSMVPEDLESTQVCNRPGLSSSLASLPTNARK